MDTAQVGPKSTGPHDQESEEFFCFHYELSAIKKLKVGSTTGGPCLGIVIG